MSINLTKGQKINLQKADGSPLTSVYMGLGWDAASGGLISGLFGNSGGGQIDLDASAVLLDDNKRQVDAVSFSHLRSNDGSIIHSGDNLTGAGDGDDETIKVDLSRVPANVETIVFVVNSFRGQTFDKVANCYARLVDATNNQEVCKYNLAEKGNHTGKIMAKVYRHNGAWKIAAIGAPANGQTVAQILPEILNAI